MTEKYIINQEVKALGDAYKAYLNRLCGDHPPKKPKISKVHILIFDFFLNLYIIFQQVFSKNKNRKYVFVNSRYENIILSLNKNDILILAGFKDIPFCLKNGIKFIWVGFIVKAFNIYYYYDKREPYIKALNIVGNMSKNQFNSSTIFLWEDNLKTGLSLSYLFKNDKNVNVITIQHGMYSNNGIIDPPGHNSNYNFLLKDGQQRWIKGCDNKTSCVMGLAYDINSNRKVFGDMIYLIGPGISGKGDTEYLYKLLLFSKIVDFMKGSKYNISYRPHHTEDISFCKHIFTNIDTTPKKDLFSKELSVYIGFDSTLLYEATFFNNLAVSIIPKEGAIERDFELDIEIHEQDIEFILKKIKDHIDSNSINNNTQELDVYMRFTRCLEKFEHYSKHSGN